MFSTGSQEKQAIVIEAAETMGTQHFYPGSTVYPDEVIEVTKDNQLIHLGRRRQESVQVLLEFAPCHVTAGHLESVNADDVGEFASPERQAGAHQTIINAL
nr:unnamed protein product [Spirometra erinaceieuropaei]